MINSLITEVIKFVIHSINLLLKPIDLFIEKFLPDLSNGLSYIGGFFNWLSDLIPWGVSYFGLHREILSLIVAYLTFKLTVPVLVYGIKIAIKWYNALKT